MFANGFPGNLVEPYRAGIIIIFLRSYISTKVNTFADEKSELIKIYRLNSTPIPIPLLLNFCLMLAISFKELDKELL